ncbi:NucA/NucB deoxyribonuclease domain-containing protein [Streptomyces sp. NPDC001939]
MERLTGSSESIPAPETLTEHGDTTALREGTTYDLKAAKSLSVQVAAPTPSITIDQCRGMAPNWNTGDYVFRVVDHYNYCMVAKCVYYTLTDGVISGMTTWRCTTAGQGTKGARLTMFTTAYDHWEDIGLTDVVGSGLRVGFATGGYNGSDGSNPACNSTGDSPSGRIAWTLGRTAVFYVSSAQSDGYGRDAVSRCAVKQSGSMDGVLWADIFTTGVRMDNASYLGSNGAGIFDRVVPIMQEYSLGSPRNAAVAEHVLFAQTSPNATYPPPDPGNVKDIPGSLASGKPLSRLMSTWDATAASRYAKNRTVVQSACSNLTHEADEECDEYPFASTWEGAGKLDGNYSVRYVDDWQNGYAGNDLQSWYTGDRILHKDLFYVNILQP